MKILIINGSPRKKGTVASLLKGLSDTISKKHETEWIDVYDLKMKSCIGCMGCRPEGECCLAEDDAHKIGRKINDADGIIIGTPTHWGNISAPLKLLFDRNVPVFMGEKSNGMPVPRHKGKKAVIVTACTTPWPFNFIANESRGAIKALREILHYGGYRICGTVVKPGSKVSPEIPQKLLRRVQKIGSRI
jgi:NAD(P)H-dependent FMN reductase